MNVLVIGHSYVKDLSKLGHNSFTIDQNHYNVKFWYKSGATYKKFFVDRSFDQKIQIYNPDYIVVVLMGNSLTQNNSNSDIYAECREFYDNLKSAAPDAVIISAQIEARYYKPNNKWNAPVGEEFFKRRSILNKFLCRLKQKRFVLSVTGPGRLDNENYYRDEVHLNSVGIQKYWSLLKSTIAYCDREISKK